MSLLPWMTFAGLPICAGRDIDYFPLLLSYAIITIDEMKLYVDKQKLTEEMCNNLTAAGITFHPYNDIYEDLKHLDSEETVLLDPSRINYALRNCIPEGVSVVESENPSVLMKSVKNETELHNIEQAHNQRWGCCDSFYALAKDTRW